jgi:ligand-binding SRPBCC domain-containing protein
MYELQFTQFIAHPRSEVFAFFSELSNLERITPPWLHFKILNPLPCTIKTGSLVNYRLKILGISFRGQTEIEKIRT